MRESLALVLALTICSGLQAQTNRDDLTPLEIVYTTTIAKDMHTLRIELAIDHLSRPTTRVAMPNWSPGAYGIRRFGERVKDLRAVSAAGNELEVTRLDHGTWSIATGGVDRIRISYSLPPRTGRRGPGRGRRRFRRRANPGGPITGMRIAGPASYVHVVGAKNLPVTVHYVVPEGWRVANGLLPTEDPLVRRAKDYDTFIDAPTIAGHFKDTAFEVHGTPFRCVFFAGDQKYDFDMPAFTEICRKIATYQGKLYGSFPFPNYVFLFHLPGGGGLEHLNSTSIGLPPGAMKRDVRAGASVTAHEFFHAWNVKRIHPRVLGPFEYQHENYTGNLWVSEGWTSYYGDLTLVRTGIIERAAFLKKLGGILRRELNKDSRHSQSVYWASRHVWHRTPGEAPRVDYYGTGEMLGALIDLEIRQETGNRKSLDDVMRFLNRWFAERKVGFEEGDIQRACTAISNHDFGEFFARHVYGTLDPPLRRILAYAGIEYEEQHLDAAMPFAWRQSKDGLRVVGRRGREEASGPLHRGDLVTAIDGEKGIEPAVFLAKHKAGDKVALTFRRGDEVQAIEVSLVKRRVMIPSLRFKENVTELQRRVREGWLTGR